MSGQVATREAVFKAADELFASGTIVTQEKIRKHIGGGSYNTIGRFLKEWKEQEGDNVVAKSYLIPDQIDKFFDDAKQQLWNTICGKVELISDNEKIAELEKENELLRDKLELARQDSIALSELRRTRENETKERQQFVQQLMEQEARIKELKIALKDAIS